jgi:hypothetical protein
MFNLSKIDRESLALGCIFFRTKILSSKELEKYCHHCEVRGLPRRLFLSFGFAMFS